MYLLEHPKTIDELLSKLETIDKGRIPKSKSRKGEKPKHQFNSSTPPQNPHMYNPYIPPPQQNFLSKCHHYKDHHYHRDCPVLRGKFTNKPRENSASDPKANTSSPKSKDAPSTFQTKLNWKNLYIGTKHVSALVDTGADLCLMNNGILELCPEINLSTSNKPEVILA